MYDEYYGLTGRPFQLTPDPLFYFESATHRKALSYLGYGLAQGEGFIIITGDVGAGKSTLVSHLMQSIDRARMTAATIVTSRLDAHDIVQMTAVSFGIDTRGLDKAASLRSIENFLHAEARTGRRCLLVVDEAQNLSIDALEELRMLSNYQLGSSALLQIFLLGQPEFRDLVRDAPELEQLQQRVIATHHLDPMDANEVEPYVLHRLARAGWTGNPSFSPDAFPMLFAETSGVPRKLNTIMNRVMLMGAVEQVNFIDAAVVCAVVVDMAGTPFAYDAQLSTGIVEIAEPQKALGGEETPKEDIPEDVIVAHTEEQSEVPDSVLVQIVEPDTSLLTALESPPGQDVPVEEIDLGTRLAALEQRVADQDDALRRVLATMIDWMDKEGSVEARFRQSNRAA
ncbi:XrtA/PEP-CTERM system-associated ATPase [Sphingorhabdus sp.]|uniref:XrtA/PEP-CTERM system-associated ATPase n=1 Tax=Sphingorhabdus sp. TaxID=1902408 RepID=UPI0039830902